MGSITRLTAAWTTRSLTVGMPSGRLPPPVLGISTRRTASARYRPVLSCSASSPRYFGAWASKRAMLMPSMPAAPRLLLTCCQAACSVESRQTLSIRLNHLLSLPCFDAVTSAANMRSVQISRSTHSPTGLSPAGTLPAVAGSDTARLAVTGTGAAVCWSLDPSFTHSPSCPPSLSPVYVARACGHPCERPRYYEGSDSCAPSPRLAGLPACLVHPSRRSASNHVGGSQVALAARPALAMCSRLRQLLAARHHSPPNRVRHPADRQFASGCSPPRLAATQLLSASGVWLPPTRTFTLLNKRLHGRTGSRPPGGGGHSRSRPPAVHGPPPPHLARRLCDQAATYRTADYVSLDILIEGNLEEKSLALLAILIATWRATAL